MPCTAKKTIKLIIEGGNDYVVTVKGNQPRLLAQLTAIFRLVSHSCRLKQCLTLANRVAYSSGNCCKCKKAITPLLSLAKRSK